MHVFWSLFKLVNECYGLLFFFYYKPEFGLIWLIAQYAWSSLLKIQMFFFINKICLPVTFDVKCA